MKKDSLLIFIIILLLLTAITPMFRPPGQVLATYNNTRIILNGVPISTPNAAPVTINGTIYLPVRALPEALQMQVEWNPDANAVYITSAAPQN